MKKLWFKAKRYGYGWYPASWEGWLVMAVWLVLFLVGMRIFLLRLDAGDAVESTTASYLGYVLVITTTLIVVAARKGEKARWRWGDKDDEKK